MPSRSIPDSLDAFKAIVEHSPDITTIVDLDARVVFQSRAVATLGYERDELFGKRVIDYVHPDDREAVNSALAALIEGTAQTSRADYRFLTHSGEWLYLESVGRYYEIEDFSGILISSRDVSEKHRLLDELERSRELFKTTFDTSSSLLSITRPETGEFIDVNDQWLKSSGYTRDEVIGRTANELGIWGGPDNRNRILERLEHRGRIDKFETHTFTKSGERLEMIVDARYIDVHGDRCLLLSATNVTEQKAMEAQLRQSQKMEAMGQLTGGVAHDFNNILGIIYGNAELAGRYGSMDDEHVSAILNACDRGAALTQQLLAFSRKQALSPTAIDLKSLAHGLEPFFRRTLGANIGISFSAEEDLWQCLADPAQMETAIINLALNARDAMPNGGHLAIELRNRVLASGQTEASAGDYVEMRFVDTGEGMSPDIVDKVFEPFFTTKSVGKGTGLGLSMIFGFVKQSGGLITIDSDEGEGTVVTLLLPRARSEHERPDADGVQINEGRGEHILLLEDDRELRHIIEVSLVRLGYHVTAVGDETEVDAIIDKSTDFDLMVSDIMLPGTARGPEIAARVKQRIPDIRLLFVSGYAQSELDDVGRGYQLLMKPFSSADLSTAIRQALDDQPATQSKTTPS